MFPNLHSFISFIIPQYSRLNFAISINIQDAAVECDDFQLALLVNHFQCNKQRNYGITVVKFHLIYAFYLLKITSPKWYICRVVH
jgi:hypothetical protein